MSFNPGLHPGDIIDNQRLTEIFRCSRQGGMRRSHQTNTLVIVLDLPTPLKTVRSAISLLILAWGSEMIKVFFNYDLFLDGGNHY